MHARRSAVGSFVVAFTAVALVAIGCGSSSNGSGSIGERSSDPAGCTAPPAQRMVEGKTYALQHFSFDAPAVWRANGTWWDDGVSLDPARPQRRADIVVGLGGSDRIDAASVEASEDAQSGSPAATIAAWKAAFDASHGPGCHATFEAITFRCEPAALRTVHCTDGLGLLTSHATTLAVFHAGATFTMACDVSGQDDAAQTCDEVNRSFVVSTSSSVEPLVLHSARQFSFATPSGWIDDGSRPEFLKSRSSDSPDADVAAAFVTPSASLEDDVEAWRTFVGSQHAGEACFVDVVSTNVEGDPAREIHARCPAGRFDLFAVAVMHDGRVFEATCSSSSGGPACAAIVHTFRFSN